MKFPFLKSLQTDILKKHFGPFLFCFLILMFLLLMQFLLLHIDNLVGKGLPISIIIELILTNLAYMVVLAVPMSVLVSTLIAFGKSSELHEMGAIKAAGISPISIMKPVLIAATGLMVFLVWFSNDVLPEANFKARSLFIDIRMQRPGFDLKPNVFYDGINGYNFLVRRIPAGTDSLFDVTLFQEETRERKAATIKAERGYLSSVEGTDILSLFLFDGKILRPMNESSDGKPRIELTRFETYRINFDLSDLSFSRSDHTSRRRDDRTMSSQAMLAVIDSLSRAMYQDIRQYNAQKGANRSLSLFREISNRAPNAQDNTEAFFNSQPESETLFYLASFDIPQEADTTKNEQTTVADGSDELQEAIPKKDTPRNTRFFILNQMDSETAQKDAARRTTTAMRNSISQMITVQNAFGWRVERIAQYQVEVHKKVSIPAACLIFVLIGAPLGILTKNGNLGFAAIMATIIFTYYWIGIIQGEKLADRLIISPFTGMWFSNITLFVLGIYLTLKVMYDFKISDLWRKSS